MPEALAWLIPGAIIALYLLWALFCERRSGEEAREEGEDGNGRPQAASS